MTKREVRTVAISYMNLKQNDIVWDIGAGTGSVSVEIALQCPFGMVYAIEKKQQAITLLEKNKKKWNVYNMDIVFGQAPDILQTLPAPDKIFIGGSSGKVKESVQTALQKNASVEIVATAISLETIRDLQQCFSDLGIEYQCTQISISKSEAVKNYHIMKAQNPVFIFCGRRAQI
jgi:precorrin-6Y C5,15-methyltransferase (decarboxylating)